MSSLLMQPGRIAGLELKNRIMMAPMGTTQNNLNEHSLAYFLERAKGGVGIVTCNIMVTDAFEDASCSIVLDEETAKLFKRLCDGCHAYGARVCAQLMPGCGRTGGATKRHGGKPMSASACTWLYDPNVICHEMSVDEIHEIEDGFRLTAQRAVDAGADLIEIHSYGGYLNDQFLTRAWNKRNDEYGGDLEGRMRFLREQIQIVQEVAGRDYPLLVKYCPDHYVPEDPEFRSIEEGIALSKKMVEYGVKALHVDAGCYERWYLAIPPADIQEMNLQSRSAKIVRENVDVPVITHGRFSNVAKAESALRNGICDFVAIGRGLLADPFLPEKVKEGRTEDIRPCISCNEGCIYRCCQRQLVTCAVNPRVNLEDGSNDIPKAKHPCKILVVGGGPGGCAAALFAKDAGHEVELWEKSPELGGNALAGSMPYYKEDMHALINYYRIQLAKNGIPVKCFTEAAHESVAAFAPDKLIWATGGAPLLPKSIPGLDSPNVVLATDALKNLVPLGRDILIVGGSVVGVETALHFDRTGRKVTVIEMAEKMLPVPMFNMNEALLREMMSRSGITWLSGTKLISVAGDEKSNRVTVECGGEQKVLTCDTVIMAMGFKPTADQAEAYRDICEVLPIGDCVQPLKVLQAVHTAWDAVKHISEA